MRDRVDVVIIGAGPYGLSIAAHLRNLGMDFRIFGRAMETWKNQMPEGMCLKSDGFASTLYDPKSELTLKTFCSERGIPYQDLGLPVNLETFTTYGEEFQRRCVPELEHKLVAALDRTASGFRVELEDGEVVEAKRVVIAAGIGHFQYLPEVLAEMPPELVTHCSAHHSLAKFKGKDVIVIGAGASAIDEAALLKQAGATVRLVARSPKVLFHDPPKPGTRTWRDELRAPMTGLGPGWRSFWCVKLPLLFHILPLDFRVLVVKKHLGPAPGWFIRDAVSRIEFNMSTVIDEVEAAQGRVRLKVTGPEGTRWMETDHVIAATGYKVDLVRLGFFSSGLLDDIRLAYKAPILNASFESSVKGLYFVGAAAAPSFGPMLRFAYGAGYTAKRLSRHLFRSATSRATAQVKPAVLGRQAEPATAGEIPALASSSSSSQR